MSQPIPHAAFKINWAHGFGYLKMWLKAPAKKKPDAVPHAIKKLGKDHIIIVDYLLGHHQDTTIRLLHLSLILIDGDEYFFHLTIGL